jgi:putative glycosyltransferase (TIGR04372 family)
MDNKYLEAIVKTEDAFPERDLASSARKHFDDPKELYRISEAYCRVGLFQDACALYERIFELNPTWIDVLDFHARALWAMHDYNEARKFWTLFLEHRQSIYRRIGIPSDFYTVDDVFTSAFGNFALFFPMDKFGYLSPKDNFYYHHTPAPDGIRSELPGHGKSVSNEAMRNCVFERVKDGIPSEMLSLLAQDDYITRLPYYCGTDLKRHPLHHHPAYAEKMLHLIRSGAVAKLRLPPEQVDECERRLALMGVDTKRPMVCLHVRESGYWGRAGDRTHSVQNADIASYIPSIQLLADNGYQIVRLGDRSMKPIPPLKSTFDYALSDYKSDTLDLYLLARSAFLLGSSSGPAAVVSMFNVPLLATNWIAFHKIPFLPDDLVLMKKFKYRNRDALLSFDELLELDYGEYLYYNLHRKNIEVIDNTPEELLSATREMLDKLNAKKVATESKTAPLRSRVRELVSTGREILERLHINTAKTSPLVSRFRGHPIVSEAQFARACYFH